MPDAGAGPGPAILHVDLDAFFAAVEQLDDPRLRGRPVVVGGTGRRGVVAAASYEARRFGVQSAMPMARARRLCPDAVVLPPRPGRYRELSDAVFTVLRSYTPLVEPLSLDEAFLDVRGARRLFGPGPDIAAALRHRVRRETGLVVSVGVAATKLMAKLASDLSKPDGLLVVEPGTELALLHPLPVERLWGVGPRTGERLARLGIRTVGDLAAVPEPTLVARFGDSLGHHLHALAWNRDDRPVVPEQEARSLSAEETFATDLDGAAELAREVRRLAERVARRLRDGRLAGRTITVKVRFADFRTVTRSVTLPEATNAGHEIVGAALQSLERAGAAGGVRLLGVGVSKLVHRSHTQPGLFGDNAGAGDHRVADSPVDAALDAVRRRFGDDALGPASLLDRGGVRTGRRSGAWGPDAE